VSFTTKKGKKKKERLLQLSNPWGKYEWQGTLRVIQGGGVQLRISGRSNSKRSYSSGERRIINFG
jgi:hypothetical protein